AVRQGLMQADSVLLEPVYGFRLEVPERMLGRAMTDVERMHGQFEPPVMEGEYAVLSGSAPVACMDGYQQEMTAYTGGLGRLACTLKGYAPCHNADEVIEASGYDADSDTENPSGSVFCAHGAGFVVSWDEVPDYMHLESCLPPEISEGNDGEDGSGTAGRNGRKKRRKDEGHEEIWLGTDEIDEILARTYHANKRDKTGAQKRRWGSKSKTPSGTYTAGRLSGTGATAARLAKKEEKREQYLLIDGYNIIFAWEELRELAERNIDSARGKLLDILCNYQGAKKCQVIAVFDAYRVQGHKTEFLDYHNIHVVYTKEAETADQYIEKFAHDNASKYDVTVATSDRLEQIIIRGQGCRLISAREFWEETERTNEEIRLEFEDKKPAEKQYMGEFIPEEIKRNMED
ncbi:MAG: NYN domain-containing protein, partial [[Clostridium] symbiosum]|nr:NYN domain-containing protein [[Clostridium] symbiosum]